MQTTGSGSDVDVGLQAEFEAKVWSKVPHLQEGKVVEPSPLVELTEQLRDAGNSVYGLDLRHVSFSVYGKFETVLLGGSIKMRPAAEIIRQAIASGKLRRDTVVFEATSGNFGIALGELAKLGVKVIVLVSRKLQGGVLSELETSGVKAIDLDVDICPAPGVQMDPNLLVARIVASNMRERLAELGLDLAPFDASRPAFEELLGRQDVIELAKALARSYGGFCPAQYENRLNLLAHEAVTGPEIDQQLAARGMSVGDFNVVCAFGTGGTSTGLSQVFERRFGKKIVHVVFPREGQDVAGIRTRSKAAGLAFYRPELYAGQHDVDFEQAKRLLVHMARAGYDIGESSALALYSVLQMVNFGVSGNFVVMLADGLGKYRVALEPQGESLEGKLEVTLEQARQHLSEYGAVVWTHPGYAPNDKGVKAIVDALTDRKGGETLEVAKPFEVAQTVATHQLPPGLRLMVEGKQGRVLLVCMSGNTSLRVAQVLAEKGVKAQSLTGGMTNIARLSDTPIEAFIRPAG